MITRHGLEAIGFRLVTFGGSFFEFKNNENVKIYFLDGKWFNDEDKEITSISEIKLS